MKERVKVDVLLLIVIVLFSAGMFFCRWLYPSIMIDNIFDILGLVSILTGTVLRMAARGHKLTHSQKGEKLVMTGAYAYVRNPMYLGSFLIGSGFVLIVLPFWSLPIFAWLFYQRFDKQMNVEEEYLEQTFGDEYAVYCQHTPRIFPQGAKLRRLRVRDTFNFREIAMTHEQRGIWGWPVLAVILESIQESIVYGQTDFRNAIVVFGIGMIVFAFLYITLYRWT